MFGKKIKSLRIQHGLTQKECAQKIGVSTRSLINYETGRSYPRQASTIAKLSELFQVSTDFLLSRVGKEKLPPNEDEAQLEFKRLVKKVSQHFKDAKFPLILREEAMEQLQKDFWSGRRKERKSEKN